MYHSVDHLSDSGEEVQVIPPTQPEPKSSQPVAPKSSRERPLVLSRGNAFKCFYIFERGL